MGAKFEYCNYLYNSLQYFLFVILFNVECILTDLCLLIIAKGMFVLVIYLVHDCCTVTLRAELSFYYVEMMKA